MCPCGQAGMPTSAFNFKREASSAVCLILFPNQSSPNQPNALIIRSAFRNGNALCFYRSAVFAQHVPQYRTNSWRCARNNLGCFSCDWAEFLPLVTEVKNFCPIQQYSCQPYRVAAGDCITKGEFLGVTVWSLHHIHFPKQPNSIPASLHWSTHVLGHFLWANQRLVPNHQKKYIYFSFSINNVHVFQMILIWTKTIYSNNLEQ